MGSIYATIDDVRLAGVLTPAEVDQIDGRFPGLVAQRIRQWSAIADSMLIKRYQAPFRTSDPELDLAATWTGGAPVVAGQSASVSRIRIEVTTPGPLGVAQARYQLDGRTWTAPAQVAALNTLGATGFTWAPGAGDLAGSLEIRSGFPNTLTEYVAVHVAADLLETRGNNPESPQWERALLRVKGVEEWIAQAVDPEKGVVELPLRTSDVLGGSAVSHSATFVASHPTPYGAIDEQAQRVRDWGRW